MLRLVASLAFAILALPLSCGTAYRAVTDTTHNPVVALLTFIAANILGATAIGLVASAAPTAD